MYLLVLKPRNRADFSFFPFFFLIHCSSAVGIFHTDTLIVACLQHGVGKGAVVAPRLENRKHCLV